MPESCVAGVAVHRCRAQKDEDDIRIYFGAGERLLLVSDDELLSLSSEELSTVERELERLEQDFGADFQRAQLLKRGARQNEALARLGLRRQELESFRMRLASAKGWHRACTVL